MGKIVQIATTHSGVARIIDNDYRPESDDISDFGVDSTNTLQTCQGPDSLLTMFQGDWLAGFVDWLNAGGVSPGTVKVRSRYISHFLRANPDPTKATPADVAAYLSTPGWKPETRRSARASLRVFFHWALDADLITSDPTKGIRPVQVPRSLPRPAPESAVAAALLGEDEPTVLAVLLAAYAGLRRAEIACLHADNIDAGSIRVTGKGGHQRRVPIHALLAAPLMRARAAGGWVFPSPVFKGEHVNVDYIGKRLKRALPPGYSGHTLRHRFGTMVYRHENNLLATQALLGHSSVATTQRYVEVADDALLAAVSSL
jgi:site-specific recombinase XerD